MWHRQHEHVLNSEPSLQLQPKDRITHHNDLNIDSTRIRHLVYIDDLNLFGLDKLALLALQQQYISTMEQRWKLLVKRSKVVLPSCRGVECLGLLVDGVEHTVGLSRSFCSGCGYIGCVASW